jgi:hypothetical protein
MIYIYITFDVASHPIQSVKTSEVVFQNLMQLVKTSDVFPGDVERDL